VGIELSQFDIEYHPRTAIKAQALADFIVEFTITDEDSAANETELWTVQTDGSSTKRGEEWRLPLSPQKEKCLSTGFS